MGKRLYIYKILYYICPLMGFLFVLFYIYFATEDVVYTDYIRLINSYLENVYSFKPYMRLDIFTRLPINYLQRIINVRFFSYSTTFDMVLGAIGLLGTALVLARYCAKKNFNIYIYALIMIVTFSLNKWEMYTNGSGWVHFLAFSCFFWHYAVLDRVLLRKATRKEKNILIWLPVITILLIAGPYSATYGVTVLLMYGYGVIKNTLWEYQKKDRYYMDLVKARKVYEIASPNKQEIDWKLLWKYFKKSVLKYYIYFLSILIPLGIYIFSRIHSVEEHAGATKRPIGEIFAENPALFPRMFIKSFASMLISNEYIKKHHISDIFVFTLGVIIMIMYLYAIYLILKKKMYQRSLFPSMLLISGGCNHILITLSRWIFLKEEYAMSSRYALQFQVGIIGILLVLGLYHKEKVREWERKKRRNIYIKQRPILELGGVLISIGICLIILMGQIGFYSNEMKIAPYRKMYFEERKQAALGFENLTDEEIKKYFQYKSVELTKKALRLLKDQELNVFAK